MNQPLRAPSPRTLRRDPDRRAAPAAPSPRLKVVQRPGPRWRSGSTRARLLVGTMATLAVVVAFALVYLHVNMAQRQFQLDKVSAQVSQDQSTYSRLRLQVAELEAPQQIIATAEGTLGMRQPASVTYLSPTSPLPAGGTTTGSSGPGSSGTGSSGTGSSGTGSAAAAKSGTIPAPAGDADWPLIKSQLAGSP